MRVKGAQSAGLLLAKAWAESGAQVDHEREERKDAFGVQLLSGKLTVLDCENYFEGMTPEVRGRVRDHGWRGREQSLRARARRNKCAGQPKGLSYNARRR